MPEYNFRLQTADTNRRVDVTRAVGAWRDHDVFVRLEEEPGKTASSP